MAEPERWITINGVHIPIFPGQTEGQAKANFFNSKHGKDVARLSSNKENKSKKKYSDIEVNQAITRFSSNEYENIRKASNGEKITEPVLDIKNKQVIQKDVTSQYKDYADAIEQYISTSPKYSGEIYRGIRFNNKDGENYIKDKKVGKEIDMKGISSWSSSESVAKGFSEQERSANYHIVFSVKNKSGVEIGDYSISGYEREILHSASSKFKIKQIKEVLKEEKDDYTGIVHRIDHYIDIKLEEINRRGK